MKILQLAIAWLASTGLMLLPGKSSDDSHVSNSYTALYEKIVTQNAPTIAKRGSFLEQLWLADVEIRLAQKTGREDYASDAAKLVSGALPKMASAPADFHSLRALALVILPLKAKGLMKPGDEQILRSIALKTWADRLKPKGEAATTTSDNNIELALALACAGFVSYYNDDNSVDSTAIRQWLEVYWGRIKSTGDLDEDASNYSGLGIIHCIELARMLGHEDDFQSPGFKRMFERQRDIVSPTGLVPEFGDGFFNPKRECLDFLTINEYAAVIYKDPSFLTAARRLYDPDAFAGAKLDQWERSLLLLDIDIANESPAPLPNVSLVTYRMNRTSSQPVVDKLILRSGNEPGSSMIMLDLYASGSHAHPFLGPSIGYYEADGVPLFHNLGRHRVSSALTGNSFWALPASKEFPGFWKPDQWFTMTIPQQLMARDESGNVKIGRQMFLRNFDNRGTTQIWFDNLRLEGKERVKLLDGFESPEGWDSTVLSDPSLKLENSQDHTQGSFSQSLDWGALKTSLTRRFADASNFTFTPNDYESLKLDLKYSGVRPYFIIRNFGQEMNAGDQALIYKVASAKAEQKGRDALGEIVFSPYIAADSRLVRKMVLTAEGYLVVRDHWSSGSPGNNWSAGQLWQLYALKSQGPGWFCSDDDGAFTVADGHGGTKSVTRSMLVKFAPGQGIETSAEKVIEPVLEPNSKGRPQDSFYTAYSKQSVVSGKEVTCTLAVVPHDPGVDPQAIADRIKFSEGADGTAVEITPPGAARPVRVQLSAKGAWAVIR